MHYIASHEPESMVFLDVELKIELVEKYFALIWEVISLLYQQKVFAPHPLTLSH